MKSQKGSSVLPEATIRIYSKVNISFWDCNHMLIYLNMIGFARILWSNWLNDANKGWLLLPEAAAAARSEAGRAAAWFEGSKPGRRKRILKFLQNQKKSVHLQIRVEGHIAGGAVPPTVTAIVAVSTLATWKPGNIMHFSFTFQCPEIVLSLK